MNHHVEAQSRDAAARGQGGFAGGLSGYTMGARRAGDIYGGSGRGEL